MTAVIDEVRLERGLTQAQLAEAAGISQPMVSRILAGERSATAQDRSQRQALANSRATAQSADEANNRANQKRPNANAILAAAQQAAKGGMGSTLLTGPQGVSSSEMSLGKSTLLGG